MKKRKLLGSVTAMILMMSLPARAQNATDIANQTALQTQQQTQNQMAAAVYAETQATSASAAGIAGDITYCASYGTCKTQRPPGESPRGLDLNKLLFGHTWEELTAPAAPPLAQAVPTKKYSRRHVARYSHTSAR